MYPASVLNAWCLQLLEEKKAERMKLDALQSELLASSNERLELVRELGECKSRLRQFEQELNQLHSIGKPFRVVPSFC